MVSPACGSWVEKLGCDLPAEPVGGVFSQFPVRARGDKLTHLVPVRAGVEDHAGTALVGGEDHDGTILP